MGDVLLRINGQRAVGHAEATQLLRSCRGDLRLEISRSQQPIAATTLQRYWRGLSARRATAARRDAARRDARPAPTWPPQEVVTANEALLSASVDRAARLKATEHVVSFRRERREATGYARSQAWREGEAAKEARAGAAKAGALSSTAARRRERRATRRMWSTLGNSTEEGAVPCSHTNPARRAAQRVATPERMQRDVAVQPQALAVR